VSSIWLTSLWQLGGWLDWLNIPFLGFFGPLWFGQIALYYIERHEGMTMQEYVLANVKSPKLREILEKVLTNGS